uniref:Uncharacterized protein n=1 Tax=Psilocybe cubensis TaxID=181762 RepID=A0A8H7XUL7_PSICU
MLGGSFVAAIAWIKVAQLAKNPLDKVDAIALYVHAVMFTILAVLSVFGFLGTLTKSRRLISTFAIALAIHLGFSLASGAFTLYTVFHERTADAVARCLNESQLPDPDMDGDGEVKACRGAVALMKGVMVVVYVVTWFIQLYAYFIVERYVAQLADEEVAAATVVIPQSALAMEQAAPMMSTTYGSFGPAYPFTAPGHAFGLGTGVQVAGVSRGRDGSAMV